MKIYEITEELRDKAIDLIEYAQENGYRKGAWSGWKIDIIFNSDFSDVFASDWNTNNIYPNGYVFISIEQMEIETDEEGDYLPFSEYLDANFCYRAEELYEFGLDSLIQELSYREAQEAYYAESAKYDPAAE